MDGQLWIIENKGVSWVSRTPFALLIQQKLQMLLTNSWTSIQIEPVNFLFLRHILLVNKIFLVYLTDESQWALLSEFQVFFVSSKIKIVFFSIPQLPLLIHGVNGNSVYLTLRLYLEKVPFVKYCWYFWLLEFLKVLTSNLFLVVKCRWRVLKLLCRLIWRLVLLGYEVFKLRLFHCSVVLADVFYVYRDLRRVWPLF